MQFRYAMTVLALGLGACATQPANDNDTQRKSAMNQDDAWQERMQDDECSSAPTASATEQAWASADCDARRSQQASAQRTRGLRGAMDDLPVGIGDTLGSTLPRSGRLIGR